MAVVQVDIAGRPYEVRIEHGLLDAFGKAVAPRLANRKVAVVVDGNIDERWRGKVASGLESNGYQPEFYEVAPGEGSKSWASLERLTDWLLSLGVTRGDHVIALGGGVVGDLTGFACAILKRGCHFIQVPTTLLAQVDSSVGGKTAINTAAGKNLVGAFHQPSLVLIDPDVLSTLPDREMRAGYAEVLKYGVLGDAAFFEWLAENGSKVLAREPKELKHAIATSVAAKARIVEEDERETSGTRALLNLGHTFGHALEAETGFSDRLLHGEAVALGMVLAARYSARRGEMAGEDAELVTRAVDAAGLPAEIATLDLDCDGKALAAHMLHDKKMEAGTLPFILLRGIGAAYLARDVAMDDIAAFLNEQLQAH